MMLQNRIVIGMTSGGSSGGSGMAQKPMDWNQISLLGVSQTCSMDSLCPGWRCCGSAPVLWTDVGLS
jgi:hypothetical protein